jgi:GNAT superfamily N-acetyltransferase
MAERVDIVSITTPQGAIAEPGLLAASEAVHRQLRPKLNADYAAQMRRIFEDGGRMAVAVRAERVLGVAVWRCYADTFNGLKFYVDDLVTDEACRSQGVGQTLIDWLSTEARRLGANGLVLDSGTHRTDAHRFYFREGFVITSFNFKKQLP